MPIYKRLNLTIDPVILDALSPFHPDLSKSAIVRVALRDRLKKDEANEKRRKWRASATGAGAEHVESHPSGNGDPTTDSGGGDR